MAELPTGLVTLMFTDIVGSTRLWEEKTEAMWESLKRHDSVIREAIEWAEGHVFKTVGDAFCAVFSSPTKAVAAAVRAQRSLYTDPLLNGEERGFAIRVRMGLHCGEPMRTENDYFGPPVNRTARISSTAHGGQILLSSTLIEHLHANLPTEISLKELGLCRLKDLDEPILLFQAEHPELPSKFPPLPSLSSVPNNLPSVLTAFLGRSQELIAMQSLLRSKTRLISIIGAGGSGKTRLAIQVATEMLNKFPGGAWWVDLSTLTHPTQVIPAIAEVFGIKEHPTASLLNQIAERLSKASTLLILDNFEQVTDAAPELDTLLSQSPPLQTIVTTRSALNLSGEHEFPLQEMEAKEAMELFASRVQQLRPNFVLDTTTKPIVERIIRRLDFNPLALELAAAQARILSVAQIEKQLSQRFKLLVSPYRDVNQRQKTLRNALDWSYDILSEPERELFLQISAFTGDFTLDDVLEVCEGEDVFTSIMRLRDQSLIRMQDGEDYPAFRMLESLREYGQEKLKQSGMEAVTHRRFSEYFVQKANDWNANQEDYKFLSFHIDNLRATLEWLLNASDFENAGQLCLSLKTLWERKGAFREARGYIQRCLQGTMPQKTKARLLQNAGWLAYRAGDYPDAERKLQGSDDLFSQLGLASEVAKVQNDRALTAQAQGNLNEARTLFLEAIQHAEESGDEVRQAMRLSNLGLLEIAEERFEAAENHLQKALGIYKRLGDSHGAGVCLCNLSEQALAASHWQDALNFAARSADEFRALNDQTSLLYALTNIAQAASRLSYLQELKEAIREGLPLCVETEHLNFVPYLLEPLLNLLIERQRNADVSILVAILERVDQLLAPQPTNSDSRLRTEKWLQEQEPNSLSIEKQRFSNSNWQEIIMAIGNLDATL